MSFKINFDEENASTGFELVKEGKYEVTILTAEAEMYQGSPNIAFSVEIRSDFAQDHQGAKILYNTLYLTSNNPDYAENTKKKVDAFVAAIGYTGKQQLDLDDVVRMALGKQVFAYVTHKADKNDPAKVYAKVVGVYPSTNKSIDPFTQNGGSITVGDDDLPF